MTKNRGWVKLWREQFGNWVSEKKPWCDGYAWSYMYARANHKRGVVNFRNEYIEINRGEFITSKLKLRGIFGWSYKQVNSFLTALELDQMVRIKTTNRYTYITILNYDKYQGDGGTEGITEGETEGITENEQGSNRVAQTKMNKNVKNTTFGNRKTKTPTREMMAIFLKQRKLQRSDAYKPQVYDGKTAQRLYRMCVKDCTTGPLGYFEKKVIAIAKEYSLDQFGAISYNWNRVNVKDRKKKTNPLLEA